MDLPPQDETSSKENDLYTDEYLLKLPSKKVVNQQLESPPEIPQSEPQTSENQSTYKKGLGGLSGLMKGEIQVYSKLYSKSFLYQANAYLMTKYNIFLNLHINGNKYIEELILELPNDCTVEECIKQSIKLFSQRLEGNKIQALPFNANISENIDDYLLYFANKKGERKIDLPGQFSLFLVKISLKGLELSQVLSKTQFFKFAIIQKQKNISSQAVSSISNQQEPKKQQDQQQQDKQKLEQNGNSKQNQIDLPQMSKNNQLKRNSGQKYNVDSNEMVSETCCLCFTIKREKKK